MWRTKKLSQVCDIQSGLWKGKKEPFTEAYVLRNTNFTPDGMFDYSDVALLQVESKQLEKRTVLPNDIILEKSGGGEKTPVGRVCLHTSEFEKPVSFSNFTARLRVLNEDELTPSFLHRFLYFLYISGKTEPMQRNSTGIRNLQISQYKDIDVPLPPLAEQQRIVAKLDAAFAEIDKAILFTSQMTKNLVRLNENLLSHCLSKITSVSTSKNLGEVISFLTDYHANGSYKILKENVELKDEPDYAWMVRSTDFEQNFKNPLKYINKNAYEFLSKSKVFEGDILMSKIGNAGKIYLVPELSQPASLAMNMFLIRLNEREILPEFLFRFLESQVGRAHIAKRLKGATTKTITKENVRSIPIPTANIEAQVSLISDVNKSEQSVNETLNLLERKLSLLNSLKSAILSQELQNEAA